MKWGGGAARLRAVTEGLFDASPALWDFKSPSTASQSPFPQGGGEYLTYGRPTS